MFSGSLEVDNIVMMLSALMGSDAVFESGNTVLILDEIQECPEARTALKFFRIDGRYDVVGTGSLLGVKGYGKEPKSIPVGSETVLDMYPLDFEEFLWANGIADSVIDFLKDGWKKKNQCRKLFIIVCASFCCNMRWLEECPMRCRHLWTPNRWIRFCRFSGISSAPMKTTW